MKRIYMTLALLGAMISTSFAQRHCDIKLIAAAPADNTVINCKDSFTLAYIFVNAGPDVLLPTDTMLVTDGESEEGFSWQFSVDANAAVGDTVIFYAANSHKNMTNTLVNAAGDDFVYAPFGNGTYMYPIIFNNFKDTVSVKDTGLANNGVFIDVTINCTTGIGDVNSVKESLQLFPNPTNSIVNFNYSFTERSSYNEVRVTDIAGRTVLTKDFGAQGVGQKQFTLDLSSLNNGMYYVELMMDNKRAVSKITVQK